MKTHKDYLIEARAMLTRALAKASPYETAETIQAREYVRLAEQACREERHEREWE